MEFRLLFGAGADRIRPEPESAPRDLGLPEPEPPRKVVAPQHTATEHYNYNGSFESVGASVSDPYSLNPDPAKNLKPDPSYFLSLFIVYLFCDDLTVKPIIRQEISCLRFFSKFVQTSPQDIPTFVF